MKKNQRTVLPAAVLVMIVICVTAASLKTNADSGSCGGATTVLPFTDVGASPFFCQIAEAFFSGLSNGTTATTYSPGGSLLREQMAAFISRTLDQSLKRGSRRALLNQYSNASADGLGMTTVGTNPRLIKCDGADLWVPLLGGVVARVRASDGKLLETWSGGPNINGLVAANGRIYLAGFTTPGQLLQIDPSQPAGSITTLTSTLGARPNAIAFDGARVWSANDSGSVSIVTLNPINVTTVTTGFVRPFAILYDGANIWVGDFGDGRMKKLDGSGNILQSILVTGLSAYPVFDGTNIWVPRRGGSTLNVIRAKDSDGNPVASASIIATLTGNGLLDPSVAAFDGERVLIANGGNSVSLFKASDFSPIGNFSTGSNRVTAACSDGLNFWLSFGAIDKIARF